MDLDAYERWMVESNLEYVTNEGLEVVVNRLRARGYGRVADGVAALGAGLVFQLKLAGFPIRLVQSGPDDFTVVYGKQVDAHLPYAEAAAKLGEAIMHALALEGKVDNSDPSEL